MWKHLCSQMVGSMVKGNVGLVPGSWVLSPRVVTLLKIMLGELAASGGLGGAYQHRSDVTNLLVKLNNLRLRSSRLQ